MDIKAIKILCREHDELETLINAIENTKNIHINTNVADMVLPQFLIDNIICNSKQRMYQIEEELRDELENL